MAKHVEPRADAI